MFSPRAFHYSDKFIIVIAMFGFVITVWLLLADRDDFIESHDASEIRIKKDQEDLSVTNSPSERPVVTIVSKTSRTIASTSMSQTVLVENPKAVHVVSIRPPTESLPLADLVPQWWVGIGAGVTGTSFRQQADGIGTSDATKYSGLGYSVEGGYKINEQWSLDGYYRSTPLVVNQNNQETTSSWQSLGLQTQWLSPWNLTNDSSNSRFGLMFGAQSHRIPVLEISPVTQSISRFPIQINTAHVGFSYIHLFSSRTRAKMHLRYQYPISVSSNEDFSIAPRLMFDGSIGTEYRLFTNFWLGAFWYGQDLEFAYKIQSEFESSTGRQAVTFSSAELRFLLEF